MKKLDFIIGASAVWDSHPLNVHHIARRLAENHRVLFIESTGLRSPSLAPGNPGGSDRGRVAKRLKNIFKGVRKVEDNLWVAAPFVLPPVKNIIRSFNDNALKIQARYLADKLGFKRPVLWFFLPTFHPVIDSISHSLSIYHCIDEYGNNPGVDAEFIKDIEGKILSKSDMVFASAQPLADRLNTIRKGVVCLPNVSDTRLFSSVLEKETPEPQDLSAIKSPRIMFVGNLSSYKVDFELLLKVMKAKPEWNVIHIGPVASGDPGSSIDELQKCPGFHSLGMKKHSELPAYVKGADVCILPNKIDVTSAGSFPLKFFEYLAVGKPVVGVRQESLSEYFDEPDICRLVNGAENFTQAVWESLENENPGKVQKRIDLAKEHSWEKRMEELNTIISDELSRIQSYFNSFHPVFIKRIDNT